jgi:predicted RNA-binding protein YlqC (UPF0109 family)
LLPNPFYYRFIQSTQSEREGGNGMVKDLISDIVKALVDQPDQVSIDEVEAGHTIMLELSVAKSDLGKVIGKQGRHAQALRIIVGAVAGKVRKNYVLEIIE